MEDLSWAGDHGELLLRQLDGSNIRSAVLLYLPKTKSKLILKKRSCFVSSMLVLESVGVARGAKCAEHSSFVVSRATSLTRGSCPHDGIQQGPAGTRAHPLDSGTPV